ncbi:minor capsid protein [Levilactobacillus acidifarinae]|nr:minor capsid protein [Levilactobacillus acidifarinae]GEO70531.1 hypothetical protein LAC03_24410 [Levilactobacillus acidifarinae]
MADKDKLTYWERRALWLEQQTYDKGSDHIDVLIRAYMQAQQYLVGEVDKVYKRYLDKSELTPDEVAKILNTQATPAQLAQLHALIKSTQDKQVKKQLQTYLDGLAVKHRITQLELLRAKSYVVAKRLADVELTESKPYYIDAMQDAYDRAAAESIIGRTQRDFGVYQGDTVPTIDIDKHEVINFVEPKTGDVVQRLDVAHDKPVTHFKELSTDYVDQMLKTPWYGKNYSQSIWHDTDKLADSLQQLFAAKQMSGMSERDMRQAIMKQFGSSASDARRLIRTESAYFAGQAKLRGWQEHGTEKYSLLAVLDFRTSEFCREHDGRVYDVKDAKCAGFAGTYPPFHPYCRTIAVAHFTRTKRGGYRTARDPIANKAIKIPVDATYRDWEQLLIKKHGQDEITATRAKSQNASQDLKQYRRYQDVLGVDNGPESFDKFQAMKYNDVEGYHELVGTVREVSTERAALNNLRVSGEVHSVPYQQEANSVFDRYVDDQLTSRRYYGKTGKARLDIDFTDHGNPKVHQVVPHAHSWLQVTKKNGKSVPHREAPGRPLTLAERIVNKDDGKTSKD